jgi:hypothetical protein
MRQRRFPARAAQVHPDSGGARLRAGLSPRRQSVASQLAVRESSSGGPYSQERRKPIA